MTSNPAVKQLRDQISEATKARAELTEQINSDNRQLLALAAADLFSQHPDLEMVGCISRESEYDDEGPYPGISLQASQFAGALYDEWSYHSDDAALTEEHRAARSQAAATLNLVDHDALTAAFGDQWLIITRKGVFGLGLDYWSEVDWGAVLPDYL